MPQAVKTSGEQNGVELNWLRGLSHNRHMSFFCLCLDLDTARPPPPGASLSGGEPQIVTRYFLAASLKLFLRQHHNTTRLTTTTTATTKSSSVGSRIISLIIHKSCSLLVLQRLPPLFLVCPSNITRHVSRFGRRSSPGFDSECRPRRPEWIY
jgi:hypothetical protein